MRQKIIAVFCTLVLVMGLMPTAWADNDVIFVSLNDNLLALESSTMPFWSNGVLYVPMSVFDTRATTINLDVYSSYSEKDRTVSVYDLTTMLVFDLDSSTCYNYHTKEGYNMKPISRNGTVFIPAYGVCDVFGLDYSYQQTSYGPLLRIKSELHWLTDAEFIDAASVQMNTRLREYNQSLTTPTTPTVTTPDGTAMEEDDDYTPVYLSILCQEGAPMEEILWGLETQEVYALFLLTPDQIAQDGDAVRQLVGSGHTIGIWAEGGTAQETADLLQAGLDNLAAAAYTTTTIAQVPLEQQEELEGDGWLFWQADQSLTTDIEGDVSRYATAMVRALAQNGRSQQLSLTASEEMSECFIDVLIQLEGRSFQPQVVTEMVV